MSELLLKNITFHYSQTQPLYKNHSLTLKPTANNSKLYGIIGPSGGGKTTLLNILGGQLKPLSGQVLIDGVDIYAVDDSIRQQLIGVQMQTTSSLRGKLGYNLTFGLNEEFIEQQCNDTELENILQRVGLWTLFAPKDGLETLIGEGGVNLSGGQRQRLNFASLYLRAKCYKPTLLLIDEPTSSLDMISEQAISKMILELAIDSITLVVAHRLNTLDNAVGIMDMSLLDTQTELKFYTRSQLIQHSNYYQALLNGTVNLE
jgi:ABC-type multidrug transport system fused ATPase/permease subunit